MICPDEGRTKLLSKNVVNLKTWMSRDDQTDPEILYWIPKYILMRGDRPLSEMGFMSPQFKALAVSQDIIGWREFTEGHISTHFYAIQSFHLSMSSSYLNGKDWTKQFISKLLQITHAQWIFVTSPSMTKHRAIYAARRRTKSYSSLTNLGKSHRRRSPKTAASSLRLISQTSPNPTLKLRHIGSSCYGCSH